MAIVSIKWASLLFPNKQSSLQDATGAAPVVPTPTFTSATTSSYTAAITGYDAQFTYTISASAGSAVRTDGNVTVSGLTANQSSVLTVTAENTAKGFSFTSSANLYSLPNVPSLTQATQAADGGTVTITNYDANATYTISITAGSASRTGNTITFTGLSRGQSAILSVTASNPIANQSSTLTVSADPIGEFEPIATITVPSGGLSTITFNNIPQTYQHLQIRYVARDSRAATEDYVSIRFNNDSSSNYLIHLLYGDGANAYGASATAQTASALGVIPGASASASIFGAGIADIIDYVSASKNKTIRSIGHTDQNGAGQIRLYSGLWLSTSAVSSIQLFPYTASQTFDQYSTFALYGIKA